MMIINAGSENKGGTFEQALKTAKKWHCKLIKEFPEVFMSETENEYESGMWSFVFTHPVTTVKVKLHTHGFTTKECEAFTFYPRTYWNGSSTSTPEIEDWMKEGFSYKIQYFKNK